MRASWILATALALCSAAHAAPNSPLHPDALAALASHRNADAAPSTERRLLPHLRDLQQSVGDHTVQLISTAMGFIGVPYRRGGTDASQGFDCSGFVRNVYAQVSGHILPRIARDQAHATTKIDKRELQPGDLVFFNTMRRNFSHVGIYVGEGQFVHAPRSGTRVRVDDMNSSYWAKRFNGARRVEVETTAAATPSLRPALHTLDSALPDMGIADEHSDTSPAASTLLE